MIMKYIIKKAKKIWKQVAFLPWKLTRVKDEDENYINIKIGNPDDIVGEIETYIRNAKEITSSNLSDKEICRLLYVEPTRRQPTVQTGNQRLSEDGETQQ